jgi:hypothetical protein
MIKLKYLFLIFAHFKLKTINIITALINISFKFVYFDFASCLSKLIE